MKKSNAKSNRVVGAAATNPENLFFHDKDGYFCIEINEYLQNIVTTSYFNKKKGVSFIFITEGELKIKAGYNNHIANEKHIVVIQPLKPFAIETYSKNIKGYVLYIHEDSILGTMGSHSLIFNLDFLETWSSSLFSISHLPITFINNIFERISYQQNEKDDDFTIVNAYVITLLLEINGFYIESVQANRAAIDLSRKYKREVYNNLNKHLSISDFAEKLSVTPNHLNKSIKSATGFSASELINKIRIIEAKYLLMLVDLTVADVSEKLGFTDVSYFSRYFKKHVNYKPSEYRKMLDLF
jgi:AraC-like DNA-binding protein